MATYGQLRTLVEILRSRDKPLTAKSDVLVPTNVVRKPDITRSIGSYDQQLYHLRQEALLLEQLLAAVSQEKSHTSTAKNQALNYRRTINKLPEETLSEILQYSVAGLGGRIWSSPALATCSRWRKTIEGTRKIWATIYITTKTSTKELCHWLRLSGHGRLAVEIDYSNYIYSNAGLQYETPKEHFSRTWNLVERHAARIHDLRILSSDLARSAFPLSSTFTVLRRFEVRWSSWGRKSSGHRSPVIPKDGLPSLETLCLLGARHGLERDSLSVEFINPERIRSLTLGNTFHVDHVWRMIPQFQALEILTWQTSLPDENFGYDLEGVTGTSNRPYFTPFTLSNLKVVAVEGIAALPLLRYIRMPSVTSLTVERAGGSMGDLLPHLLRHTSVQDLCVEHIQETQSGHLDSIFRTFSKLVHFRTNLWGDETFGAVNTLAEPSFSGIGGTAVYLCPQLRALSISSHEGITSHALQNIVRQYMLPAIDEREGGQDTQLLVYLPGRDHWQEIEHPRIRYEEYPSFNAAMS